MGLTLAPQAATVAMRPLDDADRPAFDRLLQCYESEFSRLTGKLPDRDGLFALDTQLDDRHHAFLGWMGERPFGFCVIRTGEDGCEVCEFFVVPAARGRGVGRFLATTVFDRHPGPWQVKQIAGAQGAVAFWRRVVAQYTGNDFIEDVVDDPDWGTVGRQVFQSPGASRDGANRSGLL